MRDAAWLTGERARAWCRVLAVVTAALWIGWIATASHGVDATGRPLGPDFVPVWVAGRLALDGNPAAAYSEAANALGQNALFPGVVERYGYTGFYYPPVMLLAAAALAGLPYLPALAAWVGAGFAALFVCLRRLLPWRWSVLPILAFPGVLQNAGHGQNGFLSAASLGWAMLLLERRPFLAGACLGALVFKPHLLITAPVALLAARRWRVIAGGCVSGVALCLLSWLAFGGETWGAFLAASAEARRTMEQGRVELDKMQSVFAAIRVLHGGIGLAYAAQGAAALAALSMVGWLAARRPGARAELSAMVAGAALCTPYLFDYDLVAVALPLAWIAGEAQRTGWWPYEKVVLLAAYVLPVVPRQLALHFGLPVAPFLLAALLLVVVRRAAGNPTRAVNPAMQATALH